MLTVFHPLGNIKLSPGVTDGWGGLAWTRERALSPLDGTKSRPDYITMNIWVPSADAALSQATSAAAVER